MVLLMYQKDIQPIVDFGLFYYRNQNQKLFFEVHGGIIQFKGKKAIILNFSDITEILKLEGRLQENKYKTMFIRCFSHEIRHPITSILSIVNLSQSLLEDIPCQSNFEINLNCIQNDAQQLLCISNLIRDVTDIQDELFQLQPQDVDVKEFLNEMKNTIKVQADRAGIDLQIDLSEQVPTMLQFDKKRLYGILLNLLQNALKYTKKGFIKMSLKLSKKVLSEENVTCSNLLCKLKVQDTGCGMDNQQRENLFKLFGSSQQRNFNLQKPKGIGLGLFLAQQIALQMSKIPIKVNSSLGIGSTFTVYVIAGQVFKSFSDYASVNQEMMFKKSIMQEAIPQFSPSLISCKCSQLLIVDDSEIIRMILAAFFNKFAIIEARDGKEAYRAVKEKITSQCCSQFLMIIMDCEMPNMDGFEATRRIRQLGYNGIIIGHTAFCSSSDMERCYNAGMNEVLPKPSSYQDFIEAFQKSKTRPFNHSLPRNGSFTVKDQIKQRTQSQSKKPFAKDLKVSPQSTMLQIYKISQESPKVGFESCGSSQEKQINISFFDFESDTD